MKQLRQVRITGTGMSVPPRIVTNRDLEQLMETSDEWIHERTGIRERRHVDDGAGPASLAYEASMNALNQAGLKPRDIDLIVVSTLSPEHMFPGTSLFLQQRLGLETTPAMDIKGQCTGFLYALNVARLHVAAGQCRRVLVCGVEVHSRGLDMTTRGRDTAVLFGDGAGAVILEACEHPERGLLSFHLHAQGEHAKKLWVEVPTMASTPHLSPELVAEGKAFPQMDGRFVFKHAVTRLPEVIGECLMAHNLRVADIDHFLFHQANLRINEKVGSMLGIEPSRAPSNIERYGNCSSASIPMLLAECVANGRIKDGDLICMAAFGSGFTWGSALIRW